MINIVNSLQDEPIRLMGLAGFKYEPGRVVEIAEIDNNTVCICSDGSKPFGVVAESSDQFGLVKIWYDSMTYKTDKFEQGENYKNNALLYVSESGLVTSRKPYENSILVGYVIKHEKNMLEIDWI